MIDIITLNNPDKDIHYLDDLMTLDAQVRAHNASPYLYPQDRAFYHANLSGNTINVVAKYRQQIIGYAALRKMSPWPSYLEPVSYNSEQCALMLFNMVHPLFRGKGTGKKLTQARVEAAQANGFSYLYCTTHPDNTATVKSLLALDFREIARKPMFSEQLLRSVFFLDLSAQQ